jgi:hypothetical protein
MRFITAASITQLFAVLESELPAVSGAKRLYNPRDIAQWINERVDGRRTALANA